MSRARTWLARAFLRTVSGAAALLGVASTASCVAYGPPVAYGPGPPCQTTEECVDENGPGWVCDKGDAGSGWCVPGADAAPPRD